MRTVITILILIGSVATIGWTIMWLLEKLLGKPEDWE